MISVIPTLHRSVIQKRISNFVNLKLGQRQRLFGQKESYSSLPLADSRKGYNLKRTDV